MMTLFQHKQLQQLISEFTSEEGEMVTIPLQLLKELSEQNSRIGSLMVDARDRMLAAETQAQQADTTSIFVNHLIDQTNVSDAIERIDTVAGELNQLADKIQPDNEFLSHKEAAQKMKISESTLYKWHRSGKLRAAKPNGGRLLWSRTVIDDWIKRSHGFAMMDSDTTTISSQVHSARKKLGL